MTVLKPQELLKEIAPSKRAVIALSEGEDPRVVEGAIAASNTGLADVILVGGRVKVEKLCTDANASAAETIQIHDPEESDLTAEMAQAFYELRKHKGVDEDKALSMVKTPLVYAAMLVRLGHADGTVGGAVFTTGDVVRSAIQVIGMAKGAGNVSSFFLMFPPENAPNNGRAMVYADCGLVIDPDPETLAEIAEASAKSCQAFLREDPKVALLSFSTKGSARHARVEKVTEALKALQKRAPQISSDGELQFDAAFMPAIAERKAPESDVAGQANVMVFPDLDAGNIAYKITERVAGYTAIGPILQGLQKPANDLSRGCSAGDVTEMIAISALQAHFN